MKLEGRRQSKNVRKTHPTDAYMSSGTFKRGQWRKWDKEMDEASKDTRPGPQAVSRAAKRITDETAIKRRAGQKGAAIKTGRRKGPRP